MSKTEAEEFAEKLAQETEGADDWVARQLQSRIFPFERKPLTAEQIEAVRARWHVESEANIAAILEECQLQDLEHGVRIGEYHETPREDVEAALDADGLGYDRDGGCDADLARSFAAYRRQIESEKK